jgi:hypothetical protein
VCVWDNHRRDILLDRGKQREGCLSGGDPTRSTLGRGATGWIRGKCVRSGLAVTRDVFIRLRDDLVLAGTIWSLPVFSLAEETHWPWNLPSVTICPRHNISVGVFMTPERQ